MYSGVAGSRVTLHGDCVVLEASGFGATRAKKHASPRTIPLGAIDGVDRTLAPIAGVHYIRLKVRGQLARSPHADLNVFPTVASTPADPFLDALEAAIECAHRVDDFEPDQPRTSPESGKSGRFLRDSPLLDWLQGG